MSNRERVLAVIRARPGMTDTEIRQLTGISPHQQVNQICRRLEAEGLTRRTHGPGGHIVNKPVTGGVAVPAGVVSRPGTVSTVDPLEGTDAHREAATTLTGGLCLQPAALVVTSCSKTKSRGGKAGVIGQSILDVLPPDLAQELREARTRSAAAVGLDESALLPAVDRYDGFLYQQGRPAIRFLLSQGAEVLILSGGYGLVLAGEPIGMYDCRFQPSMWPRRIVHRCLIAMARAVPRRQVVGVLSATSPYVAVFRETRWPPDSEVVLVSPEAASGAQVKTPRAEGEALGALAAGGIGLDWRSSDGLAVEVAVLG